MSRLTHQQIPPAVLRAIDHVREFFPDVAMVVFNDMGRWQFMGEDFERFSFIPRSDGIDIGLLEDAADEASNEVGLPCMFQAYTSAEDIFPA